MNISEALGTYKRCWRKRFQLYQRDKSLWWKRMGEYKRRWGVSNESVWSEVWRKEGTVWGRLLHRQPASRSQRDPTLSPSLWPVFVCTLCIYLYICNSVWCRSSASMTRSTWSHCPPKPPLFLDYNIYTIRYWRIFLQYSGRTKCMILKILKAVLNP